MNTFLKPKFDVYLYRYNSSFYKDLKLKDLEDLRLKDSTITNSTMRAKYSAEFDAIFPDNKFVSKETTLPETIDLRAALKENFIIQKMQQEADETNWLNSYKNSYKASYKEEGLRKKAILSSAITNVLTDLKKQWPSYTSNYIDIFPLSDQTASQELNCVLEVRDFSTSLNALDNGLTIAFDAAKLNALNLIVVENDVIEVRISYPEDDYTPRTVFIGFVTNVSTVEKFGDVISYTVACSGLGKYLLLSRLIKDPAIVSQFELGLEVYDVGLTPFETVFHNKNIVQIFDDIMQKTLFLTSEFAEYVGLVQDNYSDQISYDILNSYVQEVTSYQSQYLALQHPKFKNGRDDVVKKLEENHLLTLAAQIKKAYIAAGSDEAKYLQDLKDMRSFYADRIDKYNQKRSELNASGSGNQAGINTPYQLLYTFPFDTFTVDNTTLQFSLSLLLLLYYARYYAQSQGNTLTTTKGDDVFSMFTAANEDQYKVYNIAVRAAFEKFYSQVTTPDSILDDLRTYTFYEVFEDRPNTIKCRPPRFNTWQGDEIATEKVLDFAKQRDDSKLLTWMGHKFMFPIQGLIDFEGGAFSDMDLMLKYGLRADAPKQNPNVLSPELGNFWSALDLVRSNMSTRVVQVVVPATREYKIGTLYFIPNKGLSDSDITELKPKPGERVGIVGYVNNITTSLSYGDVSTHTLELIYVRKAKEVIRSTYSPEYGELLFPDERYLNFYRIPDLEMFMQFLENVKAKWDAGKTLNTASDTRRVLTDKWLKRPAIEYGGYYWAADPTFYDKFENAIINKSDTLEKLFNQEAYGNYVHQTEFKVDWFKSKTNSVPFVSQELINRLWLLDYAIKNQIITYPSFNRGTIVVDQKNTDWTSKMMEKQSMMPYPSELSGVKDKYSRLETRTYHGGKTAVFSLFKKDYIHNAEFLEYLSLKTANSDLEKTLDTLLLTNMARLSLTSGGGTYDVKVTQNSTFSGSYDSYTHASLYYDLDHTVIEAVTPVTMSTLVGVEIGLFSIPQTKRFSIVGLAQNNGLIADKTGDEVTDYAKNPHYYGLEVDLLPDVLNYWSLSEVESSLTFGLYKSSSGGAVPEPIYPSKGTYLPTPIFSFLSGDIKDNNYVKFSQTSAMFNQLVTLGQALGLKVTRGSSNSTTVHLKATYPSLVQTGVDSTGQPAYEYKLDNFVDTIHIQVDHNFEKDSEGLLVPAINKPVHFVMHYRDGKSSEAKINQIQPGVILQNAAGDKITRNYSITQAQVDSRRVNSKVPLDEQFIIDNYPEWLVVSRTTWGGMAGLAVTAAVAFSPLFLIGLAAVATVGVGVDLYINYIANKSKEYILHPYTDIEYWFEELNNVTPYVDVEDVTRQAELGANP